MKKIKLTKSRWAVVDAEDFEWLSQWNWHYMRMKKRKTGYAVRNTGSRPHRQKILMHVAIMKRHKLWKRKAEVDHINTCGCDNRKVNLRPATRSMNGAHRGLQSNNTSDITGVYWDKNADKWRAQIMVDRKQTHLGCFVDKEEAIKIRLKAEVKYFREFQHDPTNVCPLGYTGECPECAQKLKELLS